MDKKIVFTKQDQEIVNNLTQVEFKQAIQQILENFDYKKVQFNDLKRRVYQLQQEIQRKLSESLEKEKLKLGNKKLKQFYNSMSNPFYSIEQLQQRSMKKLLNIYTKKIDQSNNVPDKLVILNEIKIFLQDSILFSTKLQNQEEAIKESILLDLNNFYYSLTQIPSIYINFFENDQFLEQFEENEISNDKLDLNKSKKRIYQAILNNLKSSVKDSELFIDLIENQLIEFIEIINVKIVAIFKENQDIVQSVLKNFNKSTANLHYANKYMIIGLLKELSKRLYNLIIFCLQQTFFKLIDPSQLEKLASYIIETYDKIELTQQVSQEEQQKKMLQSQQQQDVKKLLESDLEEDDKESDVNQVRSGEIDSNQELKDEEQKQSQTDIKSNEELKLQNKKEEISKKLGLLCKNNKVKITPIVRDDGQTAILIEDDQQKKYIMQENNEGKVILVNAKLVTRQWRQFGQEQVENKADAIAKGLDAVNAINFIGKRQAQVHVSTGAISEFGSSLGYCLANINKYNSANQFLKDFGSKAAMDGSMAIVIEQVPIFGPLLLVGGMGYQSLKIYSNTSANTSTKMGQAGKVALGTGSMVGASVSGAIVGEILLPIPILGAIVGGIIGGYLGAKTSNYMFGKLDKHQYEKLFQNIEVEMKNEGYWILDNKILKVYGINNKYFQSTIPQLLKDKKNSQDLWITLLSYTMLSVHYSEKEQKAIEERKKEEEKLLKQQQQKQQQQQLQQFDEREDPNSQQQLIKRQSNDSLWPVAIEKSQRWLWNNRILVLDYLTEIDQFIEAYLREVCN